MKDNYKTRRLGINWKNSHSYGFRRRFGVNGLLNALITNLVLFTSLVYLAPLLATFLSQVVNTSIGYILYSKNVFFKKLKLKRFVTHYILTSGFVWLVNYTLISLACAHGGTKAIGAVLAIPFVATISFLLQKYFVFNY